MNELERLKAEIERVNGFREKTGRRLREKSDALQEALARLAITNDQLERVQKQAAALRGALVRLCNSWAEGTEQENYEAMKEAKAAISSDAGRDFISREQVQTQDAEDT